MRRFFFVTIHPQIIESYTSVAVFERAAKSGAVQCETVPLRNFAADKRGSVDDRPFGGGDGMILRADCLARAVEFIRTEYKCQNAKIIYTAPSGKPWSQVNAEEQVQEARDLIFICGRFGGVDQRFLDRYVTETYSLGNAVFAGGELPSLLIAESILRLLPGVLGNEESARYDSLSQEFDRGFEAPQYTRPAVFEGENVPDVLLSGDHQAIDKWRLTQRLKNS